MKSNGENKKRIGLFGGTFNPIHWGHLRSAEEIREKFDLSQVIFIPVHIPPHKKADVLSSHYRYAMVNLAIKGNSFFDVSDIELKRSGKSYSFETISQFHRLFDNNLEIFFIMGVDAFQDIHTWYDYPHFFSACNFIIMNRPGHDNLDIEHLLPHDITSDFECQTQNNRFVHKSGHMVYFCTITLLEISSTTIRSYIREGKSIKYLVPAAVEHYMREHHLYSKGEIVNE